MEKEKGKKKLPVGAGIVIIVLIFLMFMGLGFGAGTGIGDGDGEGDTKEIKTAEAAVIENSVDAEEKIENYLKVTVSESDYFFDNEKLQLDELIGKLAENEEAAVVEITDDHATKNAYDDLLDELKKNNIEYVEK